MGFVCVVVYVYQKGDSCDGTQAVGREECLCVVSEEYILYHRYM